ncbi:MAG: sigma-54 dependent transcriptional regulator [Desulfosarcinaceae bacterium]|nr:sigma-54 dependent transcriptional regulator [Desulfosarcinaceae bacterium]
MQSDLKMQDGFRMVCVDDEPQHLSAMRRLFRSKPYELLMATSGAEALALLERRSVHAALIDLKMPGMDGLTLLREVRDRHPQVKAIMLTGHGGVESAVEAIRLGAVDYLEKPVEPESLCARVGQLHKIWSLESENQRLRAESQIDNGFEDLVGSAPAFQELKRMIARVGPADASVLIEGETGTGKELVARAIHRHSKRSTAAYVPVDCGALTESVMGSELFGHVKGAFTGAAGNHLGLMRAADNGTLFLDEVGELSAAMQVKLLRTIQEREVRPVGADRSHPVNLRILAATNRNLEEEAAQGRFREDLFYRLNVVTLHVPPLRERREDIPHLVRHFIDKFSTEPHPTALNGPAGDLGLSEPLAADKASSNGTGQSAPAVDPQAMACLMNYDWPGNVRELENVIRRAVAIGLTATLTVADLPPKLAAGAPEPIGDGVYPADDSLAAYEIAAIQNALAKSDGNRRQAARRLEIGEATLYRKISKYNLN